MAEKRVVQNPVYADEMHSIVSHHGFTLLFGHAALKNPMIAIGMSPQHLKAMVKVLTQQIFEYEKKYGEISLDSQVQKEFENLAKKGFENLMK